MNQRANRVADQLAANAAALRVAVDTVAGARVIDCGGAVPGSLEAGRLLARACLADLADVTFTPPPIAELPFPGVQVRTDDPVRACLASQYAGWQVKADGFFAMGSGPMRAAAAREEIFQHIPGKETAPVAVGVLESRKHPTPDVIAAIVAKLPTDVEKLTLLVAPASSLAGTVQVVARSVETCLHKLHELKFDVTQVLAGYGVAPLPPVARDELAAIGRTNDAILYGGRVTLWVRADDDVIDAIGPKVPSSGSADHGALFAELFARYGDFYKIDPLLFSPAEVTFVNLKTGRCRSFGGTDPGLLRKSFLGG
ncbi:MAG: methenyltetrahydromethanopterin cyclohydrolase [Fimbriiglobus sp.]